MIDFYTDSALHLKGWIMKLVILFAGLVCGRRHFRNYRHFMSIGGLPALLTKSGLIIEREKRIFGETMVIYRLIQ